MTAILTLLAITAITSTIICRTVANTSLIILNYFSYQEWHCLHNDLVIENVHNISLIGRSNDYSNTSTIIQCNSSVGIVMKNITNLSVENMVIKNCWASSFSAAVTIKECSSVKLKSHPDISYSLFIKVWNVSERI